MGVSPQQSPLETGPQGRSHAQISRCFSRCFSRCLARSAREPRQFLARACLRALWLLVLVCVLCWSAWTLGSRRGGHSGGPWGARAPSWTLLGSSKPATGLGFFQNLLDLLGPRQSQSPNFGLVGPAAWACWLTSSSRGGSSCSLHSEYRPGSGPWCITWKRGVWGDTCANKARDFTGRRCWRRGQLGEEARRTAQPGLAVPAFMAMGLVFGVVSGLSPCLGPYSVWLGSF